MKTKELIAALQKVDPTGELEVVAGGDPISFVSKEPAYYDDSLEILIRDPSITTHNNIIGYKVTKAGNKVKLHLYDAHLYYGEYGTEGLDLSDLDEESQQRFMKRLTQDD